MPGFETYDLSSLKRCIVFGALAPQRCLSAGRTILPHAAFMNYYGQTEMSPLGTCLHDEEMAERPASIGRSHLPLQLKVVGLNDQEIPRGEVGNWLPVAPPLCSVILEMKKKPLETFRGGWHHTGDLVRMDETGYVYFVDRAKDFIKTGVRMFPPKSGSYSFQTFRKWLMLP